MSTQSTNKKGVADEKWLQYIQKLSQSQYPYLMEIHESCTITNNTLPDNPIVFVNDYFLEMTGYSREEVVGYNCRFLQGKYTDAETVKRISSGVKNGKTVSVQILNYRKDGTPFWNVFVILPVYDEKGTVPAFIAIQKNVTLLKLSERPFKEWLFYEVAMWLELIGYRIYGHIFVNAQIDGKLLSTLTEENMINMGISSTDSAVIFEKIQNLKEGTHLPANFNHKKKESSQMPKWRSETNFDSSSETSWNDLFRDVDDEALTLRNKSTNPTQEIPSK